MPDSMAWFSLKLSFMVASISTMLVFILGTALAYLLARGRFRGKGVLECLILLPMVLPPTVTGYYLVVLFGRQGFIGGWLYNTFGYSVIFSWHGAVIASAVISLPLMVQAARAAIEAVDQHLIDVSYTLGHSELETALRITLPLARQGIFAGIVLSFARAMGEFGATLMLAGNIPGRTNTMPLEIYSLAAAGEWSRAEGMVIFFTLVSGLAIYLGRRWNRAPVLR
ncbi:MAG: molybdate ABC transporter permease subunit [Candidatus Riflebacteria bacterium]|nr:molybdate ABC transporter permease subunit [Candidatus Riflebacteria bacterium]